MNYLKQFLNSSVEIEITGMDKYNRILARVYTPDYLNLKLVKLGLASKFLVDESETKIFYKAEISAIESELGICKKSPYFTCFQSYIEPEKETVTLTNNCNNINISLLTIKDESRKDHSFNFTGIKTIIIHTNEGSNNKTDIFWNSKTNIWNNDRDTLYLFDKEGRLVHYQSYGY
jgi:hypothetical protein